MPWPGRSTTPSIVDQSSSESIPLLTPGQQKNMNMKHDHAALDSDDDSDMDSTRSSVWCMASQFYPTCAFLGVSMAWAVAYAYLTPVLVSFELDVSEIGLVWFLASLGSCLVVPLLSAQSDYSKHPLGRRRPFMTFYLVVGAGGLVLLAYAESIGLYLGDTKDTQENALAMAVLGLLLAQIGLDGIQGMERALCTDVLEAEALQGSNGFFALQGSLGRLLGFGLGAVNLQGIPGVSYFGSQTQVLFLLSAAVLFLSTSATLASAAEKRFIPQLSELFNTSLLSSAKRAVLGVKTMPKAVRLCFVSNVLNWTGFTFLFSYGSLWYGIYIFQGNPEDEGAADTAYERGLQAASFGYLLMAAVGSLTALLLTPLSARIGLKRVWVGSLVFAAAVFLGLFFVQPGDKVSAMVLFASLGVPLAASYQLPWTEVTVAVRRSENSALYCSLFRMSEVLPFALQGLLGSAILSLFGETTRVAFVAAAVMMAVAAVYTQFCVLDVDQIEEYEEEV